MKTVTTVLLSSLLAAITVQGAAAVAGDLTWYDPSHNITCTGHADGHIACQPGQVEVAFKVRLPLPLSKPRTNTPRSQQQPGSSATAPLIQEHESVSLDTQPTILAARQDDDFGLVCTGEGDGKALGCFLSCFGQGFCTAKCGAGNACQCSSKDGTEAEGVACAKASC